MDLDTTFDKLIIVKEFIKDNNGKKVLRFGINVQYENKEGFPSFVIMHDNIQPGHIAKIVEMLLLNDFSFRKLD